MSLNKVLLMGRLGADPELKYTSNQKPVVNLSVATSERGKDGLEETTWHRVVVWGKSAENCAQYLKKGAMVFIEGTIKNRKWEGQDGVTRYATQIDTFHVTFLDKKEKPSLPEFDVKDPGSAPQKDQIDFDIPF